MRFFVDRILFPLMEFLQGRHFRSAFQGLLQLQFLSYEELRSRQEKKLKGLLAHAYAHVPFYRERFEALGIMPSDIRNLDDFCRLPTLSREDIRRNFPEKILARNISPGRRRLDRTSGSTGVPLIFFQDSASRDLRLASFLLFDSWAGIHPGERSVHIGGPLPLSFRSMVFDRLRNRYSHSVFDMSDGKTDIVLERLVRLKPALIEGYASAIHQLAQVLLRHGRGPQPKAIVTTSDMLPSRSVIQSAFGCPVFDRYGNRELGGALAQNCSVGQGLHINTDLCLVEVVDEKGQPPPLGHRGRVLLTDLVNEVMPFIRYDSGDMAVAGGECSCGRGFPLLSNIEGRISECLTLPGGRRLSPVALSHYLFVLHGYTEHILKYQVEARDVDRIIFRFVPLFSSYGTWVEKLRRDLQKLLMPGLTVDIEAVEDIPLEPSGKQAVIKFGPIGRFEHESADRFDRGVNPQIK